MDERERRSAMESGLLEVRQALEKAWYVSNRAEEYFDLRDERNLSEEETEVVILGYPGAALEHEVVHDYVTLALRRVRMLEELALAE